MTLLEAKRMLFSTIDEYEDELLEHDIGEDIFQQIQKIKSILFCFDGHTPMDDHCGLPEHRFCLFCAESTPHAEVKV